jgi:mono/diheme cytochrome c family protein
MGRYIETPESRRFIRRHRTARVVYGATIALSIAGLFAGAVDVARAADQAAAPTPAATDIASMTWDAYASAPSTATGPDAARIARGKYVATIAGCNDCHTPFKMGPTGPEPDMSRMLSGHPEHLGTTPQAESSGAAAAPTNTRFSGGWGVSFTANLTPDPDTGLGQWTFRNFKDTIRSGRHMGRGRPVLPPMPIMMYKHMTDEDLEALFTYLQSIPAIKNRVPEPLPPAAQGGAVAATPAT